MKGPELAVIHSDTREWPSESLTFDATALQRLQGKRVAVVLFSDYTTDSRPRRAAEWLAYCGMRVDVLCLRHIGQQAKTLNGVNLWGLPITKKRGGVWGYLFQYSAFLTISSAILALRSLTKRYDLIYVNNMPDVLVLSGLIPKMLGSRIILDLHDPMPELMVTIFNLPQGSGFVRILTALEKWSIRLADSVITVNRACAKLFASRSCPPSKITVVMNSPDEEMFSPPAPRPALEGGPVDKPFVIMYHGSLVERNGLELAIDAFSILKRAVPSAELRIYGETNPFLESVRKRAKSRGLQGVQYMGPRSLEEIVEAIAQCDVGIIPNQRSIFTSLNTPTRIFEFLALGKPVIAPDSSGIRDYFTEDSLIFFELGSAEDMASKLEFVFARPDLATEIARRGQEVQQSHSWRMEKLRLVEVITDTLFGPSQRRDVSTEGMNV